MTINNSGLVDLNGFSNTIGVGQTNALTISGGTLATGTGAATLVSNVADLANVANITPALISGNLNLNGSTRVIDVQSGALVTQNPNITVPNANDMSITAVVSNGGVTKNNVGKLQLTGADTYTGPTNINGSLLVDGSLNTGSGVTVNAGATLGGTGTMGPVATAGGAVNPGDPITNISSLTVSSANFSNAGSYTVELAGALPAVPVTADVLTVNGPLTLGGTSTVTVDVGGLTSTTGAPITIINDPSGQISGQFANVNIINNALNFVATLGYTSTTVTINLVAQATHFGITSVPAQPIAGAPFNLIVTALDQFGGVATGYTGTITLSTTDLGQNGFLPTLPGSYTFTVGAGGDNGSHTFTLGATLITAPTQSIFATDGGNNNVTGNPVISGLGFFTVLPNSPAQMVFAQQPSSTVAGVAIGLANSAPVTVKLEDLYGNVETGDNASVLSMAVASPVASFAAGSTTTATVAAGIATFNNLKLNLVGTYTIQPSDVTTPSATSVPSNSFLVTPAAAATLSVTGFPTPDIAGITHNFTVTAFDPFGNIATGYTGTVTLSSTDPQGLLVPAIYAFTSGVGAGFDNGVHTFNGTLRTAGTRTITASDAIIGSITGSETGILVNPAAAASLVVSTAYPSPTVAGASHNFTITALDAFGNIATGYTGTVSVLSTDPQLVPANFTYTFTSGVGAGFDNGVHQFSTTFETVGTQVLQVADSGHGLSATQGGIIVTVAAPNKLAFLAPPANPSTAGIALDTPTGVTVAVEDSYGNIETGDNATSITISVGSGPAGFTASTVTATVINGVATFPSLFLDTTGTYTLAAADNTVPAISSAASQSFVVNPNVFTQLGVTTEPSAAAVAGVIFAVQPVVKEEDQFGNIVNTDSTNTVTAARGLGTGVLQGTTLTVIFNHGVATFTGISYDVAETMNILFTTTAGPVTATSSPNTIVVANVANQLAVTTQPPATATAGVPFVPQPVVKEEDAYGNVIILDSTNTVTAARGNHGTGALLGGSLTLTLVNGVATFPVGDLTYDVAETMNVRFNSNLGSVSPTTSNSIVVSPNVATQLKVTTQPPATAIAGVPFVPQPVVAEEDTCTATSSSRTTPTP